MNSIIKIIGFIGSLLICLSPQKDIAKISTISGERTISFMQIIGQSLNEMKIDLIYTSPIFPLLFILGIIGMIQSPRGKFKTNLFIGLISLISVIYGLIIIKKSSIQDYINIELKEIIYLFIGPIIVIVSYLLSRITSMKSEVSIKK